MIESPDLEYKRFIEGLSEEQKKKASSLLCPIPGSPLAQIRAIKRNWILPSESANEERTRREFNEGDTVYFKEGWNKEPQTITEITRNGDIRIGSGRAYSPGEFTKELPKRRREARSRAGRREEEEVTPRSIPFEAVKYANAIKNKLKKNYAWAYLKWKTGKTEEKPEPRGLSTLAAQIVRMSIDKILGEPYKFKPKVEEAKTEGGKAHETGRSAGASEHDPWWLDHLEWLLENNPQLVKKLFEKDPEKLAEHLSRVVKRAIRVVHELEAPGPGSPGPGVRDRDRPPAAGEPAGAPLRRSSKRRSRPGSRDVRPRNRQE